MPTTPPAISPASSEASEGRRHGLCSDDSKDAEASRTATTLASCWAGLVTYRRSRGAVIALDRRRRDDLPSSTNAAFCDVLRRVVAQMAALALEGQVITPRALAVLHGHRGAIWVPSGNGRARTSRCRLVQPPEAASRRRSAHGSCTAQLEPAGFLRTVGSVLAELPGLGVAAASRGRTPWRRRLGGEAEARSGGGRGGRAGRLRCWLLPCRCRAAGSAGPGGAGGQGGVEGNRCEGRSTAALDRPRLRRAGAPGTAGARYAGAAGPEPPTVPWDQRGRAAGPDSRRRIGAGARERRAGAATGPPMTLGTQLRGLPERTGAHPPGGHGDVRLVPSRTPRRRSPRGS